MGTWNACECSPIAKKICLSIHLRNFGSHVTVCPSIPPPVRLHHRETDVKSYTLYLVWLRATWDCTFMLWSINSCQNRLSAHQYHMTVSQAQVSTHQDCMFFWSYLLILSFYLFSIDHRLKSKIVDFFCNGCKFIYWWIYEFINRNFALSIIGWIFILTEIIFLLQNWAILQNNVQ